LAGVAGVRWPLDRVGRVARRVRAGVRHALRPLPQIVLPRSRFLHQPCANHQPDSPPLGQAGLRPGTVEEGAITDGGLPGASSIRCEGDCPPRADCCPRANPRSRQDQHNLSPRREAHGDNRRRPLAPPRPGASAGKRLFFPRPGTPSPPQIDLDNTAPRVLTFLQATWYPRNPFPEPAS
jgi:hypothetical protein